MEILSNFFSEKAQIEYAEVNWPKLRDKTIESFNGAFFTSFVFGLFAICTDGYISKVFHSGIIEHVAVITIPLSLMLGIIFSGVTLITKFHLVFLNRVARYVACSFLILSISLSSIVSGLAFGLTIPSGLADGWVWFLAWPMISLFLYAFVYVEQQLIALNYSKPTKMNKQVVYWLSGLFLIAGTTGLIIELEKAASKIVQAGI